MKSTKLFLILQIFILGACGESSSRRSFDYSYYEYEDSDDPYAPYDSFESISVDFSSIENKFPKAVPLGVLAVDSSPIEFCIAAILPAGRFVTPGLCASTYLSYRLYVQDPATKETIYFDDIIFVESFEETDLDKPFDSFLIYKDVHLFESAQLKERASELGSFQVGEASEDLIQSDGIARIDRIYLESYGTNYVSLNQEPSNLSFALTWNQITVHFIDYIIEHAYDYGIPIEKADEKRSSTLKSLLREAIEYNSLFVEASPTSTYVSLNEEDAQSVYFDASGLLAIGSFTSSQNKVVATWLPPILSRKEVFASGKVDISSFIDLSSIVPFSIDYPSELLQTPSPSVGMLVSMDKVDKTIGHCSGSLLPNARVLTAAHCITEEATPESPALTNKTIYFYLRKSAQDPTLRFQVKSVEKFCRTDPSKRNPIRMVYLGEVGTECDYAVLELETNPEDLGFQTLEVQREAFSYSDLKTGLSASSWAVDPPQAETYTGTLKPIDIQILTDQACQSFEGGTQSFSKELEKIKEYSDSLAPAFSESDFVDQFANGDICLQITSTPFRKGNSGSPVLYNGKIVGVLVAGYATPSAPKDSPYTSGLISWIIGSDI